MAIFRFGGMKIPEELRREYAVVKRKQPDGTTKFMFPIYDRVTAERALENINSAEPPLTRLEMKAVIDRAVIYITGHAR